MDFYTTEITSTDIESENVIHQRLLSAYILAKDHVKGNLLEIGCGNGRGLEVLAQTSSEITAIDKNEELVNQLSAKYRQFNFHTKTIPPLVGFRDDLFDTVTAFQVIEHIDDDELFMKEIHRVLKPGGKAILTTPNIKYSLTRNPWHVREYTAEGLEKLFRKYFDKVETYGLTGNEKVMEYYEHNKQVVKSITKYDFLKLQYRLPRWVLQIPYEMANRLSRNKLLKRDQKLVSNIGVKDFFLTNTPDTSLDLYYVVTKLR